MGYLFLFLFLIPIFILSILIVRFDEWLRKKKTLTSEIICNENRIEQQDRFNTKEKAMEKTKQEVSSCCISQIDDSFEKNKDKSSLSSFSSAKSKQWVRLPNGIYCKVIIHLKDDEGHRLLLRTLDGKRFVIPCDFLECRNPEHFWTETSMECSLDETRKTNYQHKETINSNCSDDSLVKDTVCCPIDKSDSPNTISKSMQWIQLPNGIYCKVIIHPKDDKRHRLILRTLDGKRLEFPSDSFECRNLDHFWVEASMDCSLNETRKTNCQYKKITSSNGYDDSLSKDANFYLYNILNANNTPRRNYTIKTETVRSYRRKDGKYVNSYKRSRRRR